MANLSIRGVDPEMARLLKEKARNNGVSVNAQVIDFVRQGLGLAKAASMKKHTDLDHLAGTWSAEEAAEIASRLEDFEAVDTDLWR